MGISFPYKKFELVDGHGREIHKLRISLLDACNMSCLYCMPENKDFLAKNNWASAEEIVEIAGNLVLYGIDQIRLFGTPGSGQSYPDFPDNPRVTLATPLDGRNYHEMLLKHIK